MMGGMDVHIQILAVSALAGLAVFMFVAAWHFFRREEEARIRQLFDSYETTLRMRDLELRKPFFERTVQPLAQKIGGMFGRLAPSSNMLKLQQQLIMAGEPGGMSPVDFLGLRLLGMVGMATLTTMLLLNAHLPPANKFLFALAGGIFGYLYPGMWLKSRIRKRQAAILRAFPDVLDMLTIAVSAGLGFDAALMRVVDKWQNPLTDELHKVLYEMRMGVPRADALRHLADRTGVPEVASFVAIVIQAEKLGSSIADVLQAQADTVRERRRQWAEEQVRKAPVKMLIPLILFIFPSLFVVILGPAVPRFMRTFGR